MSRLSSRKEIRTILVDDEDIALHRFRKVLDAYPFIKVIGEAKDGKSAIELINTLKPELVFLDIQMPECTGFEVLSRLDPLPMVVFVTAYEEYAIKAFEKDSLDYLLKPVEEERLAITIERILKKDPEGGEAIAKIRQLLQETQQQPDISTIPVKVGNKISLIPIADIYYFESKEKYVFIHTRDKEYLIDYPLNFLEERLPQLFLRVNRSYIVNRFRIKEIHKYFKGTFIFIMNDSGGTKIKTGSSYTAQIKNQLLSL